MRFISLNLIFTTVLSLLCVNLALAWAHTLKVDGYTLISSLITADLLPAGSAREYGIDQSEDRMLLNNENVFL